MTTKCTNPKLTLERPRWLKIPRGEIQILAGPEDLIDPDPEPEPEPVEQVVEQKPEHEPWSGEINSIADLLDSP